MRNRWVALERAPESPEPAAKRPLLSGGRAEGGGVLNLIRVPSLLLKRVVAQSSPQERGLRYWPGQPCRNAPSRPGWRGVRMLPIPCPSPRARVLTMTAEQVPCSERARWDESWLGPRHTHVRAVQASAGCTSREGARPRCRSAPLGVWPAHRALALRADRNRHCL